MRGKSLTDKECAAAKGEPGKAVDLYDGPTGLILRVTPNGVKTWSLRYRLPDGTRRRFNIGPYGSKAGELTLSKARDEARRLKVSAKDGADPVAEKRQAAARERERAQLAKGQASTVRQLGDEYFAAGGPGRKKAKKASTLELEQFYFKKYICPRFSTSKATSTDPERCGDWPIDEIDEARVRAFIRDAEKGGSWIEKPSKSAARHSFTTLRAIFAYAVRERIVAVNPCATEPDNLPSYAARGSNYLGEGVIPDDALGAWWRAIESAPDNDQLKVSRFTAIALQICAVTLQRRTEVASISMRDFNLEERLWVIPADRAKNDRQHAVPLSDLAVTLFREAQALSASKVWLFPTDRRPRGQTARLDRPVQGGALTHAFRRVCDAAGFQSAGERHDYRLHDLRRTGATGMQRAGVAPFVISQVLGHTTDTGGAARVTGVYARYDYLDEKRKALETWADALKRIFGEK